jgi:uncharacterized protein (DUF433 family)
VQADPVVTVVTWLVTGLQHHAGRLAWRYAFTSAALDAGVPLRHRAGSRLACGPAHHYAPERARTSLDRHATHIVAAYVAGAHVRHRIAALVYTRPTAAATHRAGTAGAGRRTLKDMAYERITIDPAKMTGLPCIRDTRVTVSAVLGQLAAARSTEQILAGYPYLERADIPAALGVCRRCRAGT